MQRGTRGAAAFLPEIFMDKRPPMPGRGVLTPETKSPPLNPTRVFLGGIQGGACRASGTDEMDGGTCEPIVKKCRTAAGKFETAQSSANGTINPALAASGSSVSDNAYRNQPLHEDGDP